MNGDELWTRVLFLNANKVVFSKGCYVYLRRKGSISNNLNAKSFDVFRVQEELLHLLRENNFDHKTVAICKKDLLFRTKTHTLRYIFAKRFFDSEEKTKAKKTLSDAWKMSFRECWYAPRFYLTLLKVWQTLLRYKKYLNLQKKLKKKGLIN